MNFLRFVVLLNTRRKLIRIIPLVFDIAKNVFAAHGLHESGKKWQLTPA